VVSRSSTSTATATSTTAEDGDPCSSAGKTALNDGNTTIAKNLPACRFANDFNSSLNILNFITPPFSK
jgi:hypothetical protein